MGIKEELQKALILKFDRWSDAAKIDVALWACTWMAERCARELEEIDRFDISPTETATKCRQLIKDLE